MPGRLLNFRRNSPTSSTATLVTVKDQTTASPNARRASLSPPRYGDTTEQRRNSFTKMERKVRRQSGFDGLIHYERHHSSDKKEKKGTPKTKAPPHTPAKLGMVVESPPLVFYNLPRESSGALFSGQLKLDVIDQTITIDSFTAQFICSTTTRKPIVEKCQECITQNSELKKWNFLDEPGRNCAALKLLNGEHKFPFSYLLPGHLPASTSAINSCLSYHIEATAHLSTGENVTFRQTIDVKRAIIPGPEKHSVRIFPPTNLTAQVTLPPVIHPIGEFNLQMHMAGITSTQKDSLLRWRLRKLQWRIEEHQKSISPACTAHSASTLGDEDKGRQHTETRVVGSAEVKSGWKTNDSDDTIEVEFPAAINPNSRPVCDMQADNGLDVKHTLVLEMVVAEEWSPLKKPHQSTPTGAARVLRTQFTVLLTERSGMGIAWDEEQPPVYEDVPASPPAYHMDQLDLEDISDIQDLEGLRPHGPRRTDSY